MAETVGGVFFLIFSAYLRHRRWLCLLHVFGLECAFLCVPYRGMHFGFMRAFNCLGFPFGLAVCRSPPFSSWFLVCLVLLYVLVWLVSLYFRARNVGTSLALPCLVCDDSGFLCLSVCDHIVCISLE